MTKTEQAVADFISQEILRSVAPTAISPDRLLLEESVLDSLGLQQLVLFLESEFGIQLGDEHFLPENFESIRSIARLMDELRR